MDMRSIAAAITACCLFTASALAAERWTTVEQPELEKQLSAARTLEPHHVADPPKSVLPWGVGEAPNPDGKTWDLLVYYMKEYRHNARAYIVDLGSGTVTLRNFTEFEQRSRPELTSWTLHPDGMTYGAVPDFDAGTMLILRYDSAKNTFEQIHEIRGLGGEKFDTALGHDGLIYGTGTFIDGENRKHAAAYSFDPKTEKVRNYGKIGPAHDEMAWGHSMGVDDTHIYVASGQIPWWLVAIDIKTGEQKVILEATGGSYKERMWVFQRYPGSWVMRKKDDNSPKEEFWLYHGEAIPKTSDTPPWPPKKSPMDEALERAPIPDVYTGQVVPDADGKAALWIRERGGSGEWRSIPLPNVETHPLDVFRLVSLPDGRMFGVSYGYTGRFLFDPKTKKLESLGGGGTGIYTLAVSSDRVYWSGYPSAMIFEYDWTKPWTLDRPAPPGSPKPSETDQGSNPRRVGDLFEQTRVKKVMDSAVGADGRVYFGGTGQRDYVGGGFGWYDPKTQELGGMWRPFSGYRPHWVEPSRDGRVILISTRTETDELNNNQTPESAKVFAYDTQSGQFLWEAAPVKGAVKAGPIIDAGNGRLLGITEDPVAKGGGLLYGLDAATGETLFQRKLTRVLNFPWTQGNSPWDFTVGPDGFVWTYLGDVLVRIDPSDTRIHVVGRVEDYGHLHFVGSDVYLTHGNGMRMLSGVALTQHADGPQ